MGSTIRLARPRAEHGKQPTGETKQQRLDREHDQLFNELRSIIPGVQIQGAFLFTVAFTERFERLNDFQRDVYYFSFLLTAGALVLLFAPAAFHRVRFRQHDKEVLIKAANVEMIAALFLVSLSLAGTLLLISDLIVPTGVAVVVAVLSFAVTALLWWGFPLGRSFSRR